LFDPEKEAVLETDASDRAIGACLTQRGDDGKIRPVAYYSRKMTEPELNYDIHDKELLAVVEAFREWRVYLEGAKYPVQVYTDHKNLLYWTTTKQLNRRQVRWSETLASYDFRINHVKGTENGRADALSRRPDYMTGTSLTPSSILQWKGKTLTY
jgi:RNase H-like domain found in reverse transcriptase